MSSNSASIASSDDDVEQGDPLLREDEKAIEPPTPPSQKSNRVQFLVWTVINTLATIAIVFTNKAIFSDRQLRQGMSAFAAFHFLVTTGTLYIISRPPLRFFEASFTRLVQILPLALTMCCNVVLPNLSLAYSTVTFYQIARVMLTPTVAVIHWVFYGVRIPRDACLALIPTCMGVGLVTYFDTKGSGSGKQTTSTAGVMFAFSGILASSLYTVWVKVYQTRLKMNSMQLLFNSAPAGAFLLLYVIPFTDHAPEWTTVSLNKWVLVLISGVCASLINISQFFIITGAGPVGSTVVGHFKTCSIVALGWMVSGRKVTDKGLLGVFVAILGIIAYSVIMLEHSKKKALQSPSS